MPAAVEPRASASNQYELLARLAEGGMAEIFLARANSLAGFERHVVLKRILPARTDDPMWTTMFLDEARLAAQLHHPNIAQVFDLGQIGDAYFYTMEYVHGVDARDVLARTSALGKRVPVAVALAIAAHAAAGLAHAHERTGADGRPLGVVHRDVSPSNIMVSYEGAVKLVDFGVAKARSREQETIAGAIMGKVAYLSPEQCRSNASTAVDHRSDLFSLGIVLYELLTGARPFRRDNDYETLQAIVRHQPPPPSTIARELPPALDGLVMRALAKEPGERFASAQELLDAIELIADASGIALSPRDVRKFMRDIYGTRPEPWRELEALADRAPPMVQRTETIGLSRILAFPADAAADHVPLLPAHRPRSSSVSRVVASLEASGYIAAGDLLADSLVDEVATGDHTGDHTDDDEVGDETQVHDGIALRTHDVEMIDDDAGGLSSEVSNDAIEAIETAPPRPPAVVLSPSVVAALPLPPPSPPLALALPLAPPAFATPVPAATPSAMYALAPPPPSSQRLAVIPPPAVASSRRNLAVVLALAGLVVVGAAIGAFIATDPPPATTSRPTPVAPTPVARPIVTPIVTPIEAAPAPVAASKPAPAAAPPPAPAATTSEPLPPRPRPPAPPRKAATSTCSDPLECQF